jgi:membrane protease subunit HflC
MRWFISLLVLVALLAAARMSFFTVDPTEFVYVTQFGRHVATYDGADRDGDAGLHLRWPWVQSVQRLDRRLQVFDLPVAELLTHDPEGNMVDKTITVEAYVCWRIADKEGVDRFVRRVGSADRARDILRPQVSSQLGALIGQMRMDDLVGFDAVPFEHLAVFAAVPGGGFPGGLPWAALHQSGRKNLAAGLPGRVERNMERLRQRLLNGRSRDEDGPEGGDGLKNRVAEEYGIELVDIRLRRLNHPAQVRETIFERIRSERAKKATDYRSEGAKQARNITSTAEAKVKVLLAEARARADELVKGQAVAEVYRILNEAQVKDPKFYEFVKALEVGQDVLGDGKTRLLLSTHRDFFDALFKKPHNGDNGAGKSTTGAMPPAPGTKGGGR